MKDDYNLNYFHKETGKAFKVKRITSTEYRIKDPVTEISSAITWYGLNTRYKADKMNKKKPSQTFCDNRIRA